MILKSPGDIAFSIFGFPVYFYGIILALACLIAVFIAQKVYSKVFKPADRDVILNLSPYVVILGILGARLYYCLVNFAYFSSNPLEILDIRGGGLSIHGGILAGIVGLWFAAKKYKISYLTLLDVYSVGTVFAQSLGRWGNFFNNEAFGRPFDGFLKLYIPFANRPSGYENFQYFHPAFLYESLADFLIFLVLLKIIAKYGQKYIGLTFCAYLGLYSLVRFFIEGIRLDSAMNLGNIHIAQLISVVIFVFALVSAGWVLFLRNKKTAL